MKEIKERDLATVDKENIPKPIYLDAMIIPM